MKKAIFTFYSTLATLLILEFLLTLWSVIFYNSIFTGNLFLNNDNLFIRILILGVCSLSLGQVYFLCIKGKTLKPVNFWMLLGLNSASAFYLNYSNEFIDSSFLKLNTVLFSISFFAWIMLLLLGASYKAVSETAFDGPQMA